MIQLVTLAQAKAHLNILNDLQDFDIQQKVTMASAILLREIKKSTVPAEWYTGSPAVIDAPADIQAWTLVMLGELFCNRESSISDVLSQNVRNALQTYWDPALA